MKIGIDISQIVYEGTGVGHYVRRMVEELLKVDKENEYILFGASFRQRHKFYQYFRDLGKIPGIEVRNSGNQSPRVRLIVVPIQPTLLDLLWNRLHIVPVEWFTGLLDVFWSSDWTQPPLLHARGVTTIHDLSILRYPEESHNKAEVEVVLGRIAANIVATQKRRLIRAAKLCQAFFCDSEATAKDAEKLLGIAKDKLKVVYLGYH